MLTPQSFQLFSIISFDLYPASILGAGYQNAKVTSIMDMRGAIQAGFDPAALHASVYPTLPPGVPNDPSQYGYLLLQLANGNFTVIGIPWIVDSSLVVASTASIQFTVDNISPTDQNTILQALAANGFTAVNVKILTQA